METIKPRLTLITDGCELAALQTGEGLLDVPRLIAGQHGWYCDSAELRAWRMARSPSTSGAKHEG